MITAEREYNQSGILIHKKLSNNAEYWYNAVGLVYHTKWSDGVECDDEYDENSRLIHRKCTNGYEIWYQYDKFGNEQKRKWIGTDGKIGELEII